MINNVSSALNAYQQALTRMNTATEATTITPLTNESTDSSFGNMVQEATQNVVSLHEVAEATSIAGIDGKASIQDVVLAVSNAEVALETVVALRDTAIQAYNTIIQMTI